MCWLEEDEKINDTLQMNSFASMNNKLWKMWQEPHVANFE